MSEPILSVERVTKRFATVTSVDALSFHVERGEIFALLGPNGAGKTTTVRMLTGILEPDSGTVAFHGEGRTARADPTRIGYLPEERGLYADGTVLRTIAYFAALRGVPRAEGRERALQWLARFELSDRAEARIDSLSKGNQQKVQFIASLLHRPDLAVLDEPFSGFDPVNQDLVVEVIRELRREGMTILLSAHHMDLVESLADRVLLIHQGRELLGGTLAELRAQAPGGEGLTLRELYLRALGRGAPGSAEAETP